MGHLPHITFVSFGRPKAIWRPVLEVYEKRLRSATNFRHVVLKEKGGRPAAVKAEATKQLTPHTGNGVATLVFDERGTTYSSPGLADLVAAVRPNKLTAIIGTSYGLTEEFLSCADHLVALGKLTLPHELARVTALEQLYRADTILAGHPYHHQ